MNIIVDFCMTCFHGPLSVGLVAVVNARASPVYTRSLTGSLTSSLCVGRETHSLRYNSSHNYLYIVHCCVFFLTTRQYMMWCFNSYCRNCIHTPVYIACMYTISAGRDQVLHVWNLTDNSLYKTLPVFEVTCTCLLHTRHIVEMVSVCCVCRRWRVWWCYL